MAKQAKSNDIDEDDFVWLQKYVDAYVDDFKFR